ncbi:MAG TPA: hypothetical protein PLX83_16960 [bacterium]|nr:hypothetical protein [bacterium]
MTNRSKQKGDRVERSIRKLLESYGLQVNRSLLRAQAGREVEWDLLLEDDIQIQVKARKSHSGFRTLDRWMGSCDVLVIAPTGGRPMVYMPLELLAHLAKGYYQK